MAQLTVTHAVQALPTEQEQRLDSAADRQQDAKEVVRLKLGRWLALVLELELAADILRTAVAPTWTKIGHCQLSQR